MSDYNDGADDLRRFEQAKTARAPYEARWQEIAERILPTQSNTFFGNTLRSGGQNKNRRMIDVTGAKALQTFASICESISTPHMQRWHRLRASNRDVMKDRGARLYFEEATNVLFNERYAAYADFAGAQYESNISVGAFGTGVKFVEKPRERFKRGLRYRAMPLGSTYLMLNYHNRADTLYRPMELTARQFRQAFDRDDDFYPKLIADELAKIGGPDENKTFTIVHCVSPRSDYEPERIDIKGMEYRSRYIFQQSKEIIREDGYHTWPFPIGRYFAAPSELYSRGPGDLALGAVKTVNAMKVTVVEQGQRAVAPLYLAHDDGIADQFNATPGAITAGGVTQDGRPLVHALQPGNIAIGKDLMDDERKDINDIFLVSLFQILVERPEMTAEQFIGLMQEKGQLLAPVMSRMVAHDLGPLIDRELELLSAQGMLPPQPGILKEAQGEYTVEYDSPLSRLQKSEESSGFMRLTSFLLNVAAQTKDPSKLDRLDFDAATPELAEQQAVPSRWIRSDDDLARLRGDRQDQSDTQQMVDAAPGAAQMVKALSGLKGAPGAASN